MTQQTARTFIVTLLAICIFGAIAYNGFFLALAQVMRAIH